MKILALDGSPRKKGNSSLLLEEFLKGATENDAQIVKIKADTVNIKSCKGCLKCGIYKECVLKDDDWPEISKDILEADTIVISSPIYFHHLPGPLKMILDRFRSFMNVKVTETDLVHKPWRPWSKRFVLLLTLGSPVPDDAQPVIDLFNYMTEMLGTGNSLEVLTSTCVQMNGQIDMNEQRLINLYSRMGLPEEMAHKDFLRNQEKLKQAFNLGAQNNIISE